MIGRLRAPLPCIQLLYLIEKTVSKDCIIASNTSSLSIEELSTSLEYPERFIGMHFFSPANVMKLLEVVRADATSERTAIGVLASLAARKSERGGPVGHKFPTLVFPA